MVESFQRLSRILIENRLIYPIVVILAGVGLWQIFRVSLRQATQLRLRRLKDLEVPDLVETTEAEPPPETRPFEKIAEQSIRRQFWMTRRFVLPGIFFGTLILVCLPYLDRAPAALLSLLVGGSTVLLGIAARPVIENAIAGVVISYSRTLNLGDIILLDEFFGSVEDIGITHTTIKIWDWRRYVLPNSQMLTARFINYTLRDSWVWAKIEFWVSHEADLERVQTLAIEAISTSPHLAETKDEPAFWVMELGKESVRCWVAGWAINPGDGWNLSADTRIRLSAALRKEGISTHSFHHSLSHPEELDFHPRGVPPQPQAPE